MALGRLDIPGVILYNGTIYPGTYKGRAIDVVTVFEAVGAYQAGTMTLDELYEIESAACPGPGACGGQYTANTMSTVLEFMGLSPAGLNGIPAEDPAKDDAAKQTGELVMRLVRDDVRPRHIVTRESLENGVASIAATGGSTNGVLHMLAIAHEYGLELDIDEFGGIADRTPIVADMRPGGRFTASQMYDAGGVGLVMRELLKRDLLHGDARTVDGRTIAEIAAAAVETAGQQVVVPIETPFKAVGGLAILRGSLAPEGCVVKLAGHERRLHTGRLGSSTRRSDASRRSSAAGSSPAMSSSFATRGRPAVRGCVKCSRVTGAIGAGTWRIGRAAHRRPLQRRHARPDDRPRRAGGGPRRSDRPGRGRRHDHDRRRSQALDLEVDEDVIAERRQRWAAPPPVYRGGVMAKYAALVSSASSGAVTTAVRMDGALARVR